MLAKEALIALSAEEMRAATRDHICEAHLFVGEVHTKLSRNDERSISHPWKTLARSFPRSTDGLLKEAMNVEPV